MYSKQVIPEDLNMVWILTPTGHRIGKVFANDADVFLQHLNM